MGSIWKWGLQMTGGCAGVLPCFQTLTLPLTWAGAASVDVAVFCLALMGTDYPAFLREAHRVLRPGGRLWIAEVLALIQRPK